MKRNIRKHFDFNREEAEMLRKKAKKACLSEVGLIRFLLKGYEPKEKPGDEFYEAMNQMKEFTEKIETLRLQTTDESQCRQLQDEIDQWHRFQAAIELRFLTPDESQLKWR